jgi:hypothetical protein
MPGSRSRLAEQARGAGSQSRLAEQTRGASSQSRLAEQARGSGSRSRLAEQLAEQVRGAGSRSRLAERARGTGSWSRLAELARGAGSRSRLAEQARGAGSRSRLAEQARGSGPRSRLAEQLAEQVRGAGSRSNTGAKPAGRHVFYGGLCGHLQGLVSACAYMQKSDVNAELRSAISSMGSAVRTCSWRRGEATDEVVRRTGPFSRVREQLLIQVKSAVLSHKFLPPTASPCSTAAGLTICRASSAPASTCRSQTSMRSSGVRSRSRPQRCARARGGGGKRPTKLFGEPPPWTTRVREQLSIQFQSAVLSHELLPPAATSCSTAACVAICRASSAVWCARVRLQDGGHRLLFPDLQHQGADCPRAGCEDRESRRGDHDQPPGHYGDHRRVLPGRLQQLRLELLGVSGRLAAARARERLGAAKGSTGNSARRRETEIKHDRIAMLAAMGYIARRSLASCRATCFRSPA